MPHANVNAKKRLCKLFSVNEALIKSIILSNHNSDTRNTDMKLLNYILIAACLA